MVNVEYKTCKKCGQSLPATSDYFRPAKRYSMGLYSLCRSCEVTYQKEYREQHADRIRELAHLHYTEHKDEIIERVHKWGAENPERTREYKKRWRESHKAEQLAAGYGWQQRNYERFRENQNRSLNERRHSRPDLRISHALSTSIQQSLHEGKSGRHWEEIVGYSLDDLMEHLESQFEEGMTWDNYSKRGWHIDHRKPIAAYHFTSPDDPQFKECWALSNLRPMWWRDNISKGAKYQGVDYKKYRNGHSRPNVAE